MVMGLPKERTWQQRPRSYNVQSKNKKGRPRAMVSCLRFH